MKIHTSDNVVIISGKDKGKTGSVLKVLPVTGRVVVSSINMRTKHIKATPQQAGQKIQYEGSISISNVMIVDSKTKKRTRVGFEIDGKGKKRRIAKRSGEVMEKKKISAKSVRQVQDEKESSVSVPVPAETMVDKPKAPASASASTKVTADREATVGREEDMRLKKVKADKKEAKEEKIEETKEEKVVEAKKDKKPEKTEKVVAAPAKKPFWKKILSFGGAAADEAEVEGESHMKENRSIPGETPPNRHNTTRGS